MKIRKILCLILALVFIISAFSGCSKDSTDTSDGTSSSSSSGKNKDKNQSTIENVYKAEYIPIEADFDSFYNMVFFEDNLYFNTYVSTDESYKMTMFEMSLDGTELREIPIDTSEFSNFNGFIITEDGNILYNEVEYIYTEELSEENFYLKLADRDGNLIKSIDLSEFKSDNPDEYFYINSIEADDFGNIYLNAGQDIIILNSIGEKQFSIETSDYVSNLYKIKDGTVIMQSYGETGMKFNRIDLENKAVGEELIISNLNYNYSVMDGSEKYDLYFSNTTSVFGFNFENQELIELINWINSDINTDSISATTPLPDGRFACFSYDWESQDKELIIMTETPADEIPERTILTLSTPYLDYEVKNAVIDFNKTNEKYRIKINDYSTYATYDDYNAGTTRFNTDLIAGNIPDIIVGNNNTNLDNYIAKGILLDLYTMFEKDPDYSKEDFVQSLLKAAETDGKLYFFTPSFSVQTYAAKTSLVGPDLGWTMDDLNALISKMPDSEILYETTKSSVLNVSLMNSLEQFIDPETGKCSFNTQGFIDLLEFCNTFPEEIDYDTLYGEDFDWEAYDLFYETMYRNDNVILMDMYLSDFITARRVEKVQFGEPITFVGFPSSNEKGSVFNPGQKFAITSKSKNQDGAWEFIRYFMSDEYQSEVYMFPAKLDALNKKAEEDMKPQTYEDENGNLVEMDNIYYLSSGEINVGYPDQADIDKTMELINSITSFASYDEKLNSIVQEEAGAFFSGQKTAAQVADLIQNKVSIYIAESR